MQTPSDKSRAYERLENNDIQGALILLSGYCQTHSQDVEAWFTLGTLYGQTGTLEQAISCLEHVISIMPTHADALTNLGVACMALGKKTDAKNYCKRAIAAAPHNMLAHYNLGCILQEEKDHTGAITHFNNAIQLQPDNADVLIKLGISLRATGRLDEAVVAFNRALETEPHRVDASYNAALALHAAGQNDEAINHLKKTLVISPYHFDALVMLGRLYSNNHLYKDAISCYERALSTRPDQPNVRFMQAKATWDAGKFDKAEQLLKEMEKEDLGDKTLLYRALGETHLARGQFEDGWKYYKYRHKSIHSLAPPDSLPDDLAGMHCYLNCDQGLGDDLFFLRFVPELKSRGARITFNTKEKLLPVIQELDFIDEVITGIQPPQDIDLQFSIVDLPLLLGMKSIDEIPEPVHLVPDVQIRKRILDELQAAGTSPFIGITWRAGLEEYSDALRKQVPIELLCDMLKSIPCTIVLLQRQPEIEELNYLQNQFGNNLLDYSHYNDDLLSMIALLSVLDEYVGVSNTNMHLAASINKTARVLLPNPAEWRWMTEGTESPWFPGFSLYRQATNGNWSAALSTLANDIKNSLNS